MDCSLPDSVCGVLQARILEPVAMPSSRGSSDPGIEPVFPALPADCLLLSHGDALLCADWASVPGSLVRELRPHKLRPVAERKVSTGDFGEHEGLLAIEWAGHAEKCLENNIFLH